MALIQRGEFRAIVGTSSHGHFSLDRQGRLETTVVGKRTEWGTMQTADAIPLNDFGAGQGEKLSTFVDSGLFCLCVQGSSRARNFMKFSAVTR